MADKYQRDITTMLHSYGIFTRHEKPIPIIKGDRVIGWNSPDRGSPDLTGGLVHLINMEVKTASNKRFDFSLVTEKQLAYARKWRKVRGCEFWYAILFPMDRPIHGRMRRDGFVIPYPILISTMELLEDVGVSKSIPYELTTRHKQSMHDNGLEVVALWQRFRLAYEPQRKWHFPYHHPFYLMYLMEQPHLYDAYYDI